MSVKPSVMTPMLVNESVESVEKSVIGAVLVKPEFLVDLAWLSVEHFVGYKQKAVWTAIRNLEAAGQPIDVLMVGNELDRTGRLNAVGGEAELGMWILGFPTLENTLDYASRIRENALHRATLLAIGESQVRAVQGSVHGTALLVEVQSALSRIEIDDVADKSAAISVLAKEHVKLLEHTAQLRADGRVELTGAPTGVDKLDEQIGGWQYGIASIVCGRPGHGKSSLMLASAEVCSARVIGVHVFSLEDPRKSYMNRAFARRSGVPINSIATCSLTREDMTRFAIATHDLVKGGLPWIVDDSSGITAEDLVRSVRRHRRENGTRLVIVDYLQLLKPNAHTVAKSRHEQIGETLNTLADAAKADDMAYVIGSQLNRGVEARSDKRPVESDLRESGTIEERAKCIIGLYRGARYSDEPQADIDVDEHGHLLNPWDFTRTVQLLVLKNSQGPAPGRVLASWDGPTTRIS